MPPPELAWPMLLPRPPVRSIGGSPAPPPPPQPLRARLGQRDLPDALPGHRRQAGQRLLLKQLHQRGHFRRVGNRRRLLLRLDSALRVDDLAVLVEVRPSRLAAVVVDSARALLHRLAGRGHAVPVVEGVEGAGGLQEVVRRPRLVGGLRRRLLGVQEHGELPQGVFRVLLADRPQARRRRRRSHCQWRILDAAGDEVVGGRGRVLAGGPGHELLELLLRVLGVLLAERGGGGAPASAAVPASGRGGRAAIVVRRRVRLGKLRLCVREVRAAVVVGGLPAEGEVVARHGDRRQLLLGVLCELLADGRALVRRRGRAGGGLRRGAHVGAEVVRGAGGQAGGLLRLARHQLLQLRR
mmetsp:Transcript_64200/g.179547  ORF Transcript_64200/g.179547 Transcript_64200/m.179547 type:complete len:354 (+) Transcript_64200:292-1353(+)